MTWTDLLALLTHNAPAHYQTPVKVLPLIVPLGDWSWGPR